MRKKTALATVLLVLVWMMSIRFETRGIGADGRSFDRQLSLPSIHNLDSGLNYTKIQDAINAVETLDGNTILIDSETYYENVVVNKSIVLVGENKETTAIDARGVGNALDLLVDGIVIRNLTISYGEIGVAITNSRGHVIDNNIIRNNVNGATGSYYTDTIYENNLVKENEYGLNFGQLSGPSSTNNTARNNEIYDNFAGIYVSAADGNNTIFGNDIHDNGIGLVLDHTQNNSIVRNNISHNNRPGTYMYGIYFRNAVNNTVKENTFSLNNVGLHFESSNENRIFHNNFKGNTHDTDGTSYNIWDDNYPSGGNFWDRYQGVDNDADRIGDTAYPVDADNTDRYPLISEFFAYPIIRIVSPQDIMYPTNDVALTFTVDKPAVWIGYSLDGQANVTIAGNITLALSEGFHNVAVYANSTAGDMGASSLVYFTIDVTPPGIVKVSQNPLDDVQPNQAVTILVNVTDTISDVKSVRLTYNTNTSTLTLDFPMTFNLTSGFWEYTIPGQQIDTLVKYGITAYDNAGNNRTDDNAGQYYVYTVISEFPPFIILPLFMVATLLTTIVYRRKHSSKLTQKNTA